MKRGVFIALLLVCSSPAAASPFAKDGDDVIVKGQDYRLNGIDAFEAGQICRRADGAEFDCGAAARSAMAALIDGADVVCEPTGKRSAKRLIARCSVNGRDLEAEMVRTGWAFVRPDFAAERTAELCRIEAEARAARRGAWAGQPFDLPYFRKGGTSKSREQVACP